MSNQQENPLKGQRIEFHILQSFPVTCLNRDDVGAPKTAIVGGSNRARVSSQCWKRQVRLTLQEMGVKIGIRTKKVTEELSKILQKQDVSLDKADASAKFIADSLVSDTLLFLSESEIEVLAQYAENQNFDTKNMKDKDIFKVVKSSFNPRLDGLDIALFGRMVAKAADLNVEAAASFSHAISTHRVVNELDFFTAIDDRQDELGAAHMGSLEFNSATYYRYVSLDLGQLYLSIGDLEIVKKAVDSFIKALYQAIPSARQTTQSGASFWEYARVLVRRGQRMQVPFETAVKAKNGGFLQSSIEALDSYIDHKEKISGSLFGKIADYKFGLDNDLTIDKLSEVLQQEVK